MGSQTMEQEELQDRMLQTCSAACPLAVRLLDTAGLSEFRQPCWHMQGQSKDNQSMRSGVYTLTIEARLHFADQDMW